ncbi:hypothetical protein ACT6QG_05230 [Xanthobacter sp. TB0136]|uniref:hypothetical protein n=1 Tax=Xanthobacter sp. TB0136 TaxID=3459177 RepID=UPI00403988B7
MSKIVQVGEAEYLEPADYNRMGEYPRAALDDVVGDAIGYPAHWAGFTVSVKSAQEVEISAGRYFEGRIVWASDAPITLNLITYFPMAASDEKWLALVLRGEDVQIHEARAFETATDPETSEPVSISTPVVLHRDLRVVVQQGSAVPPPASQPVIAETDACIAFVRVKTTGIQEIVPGGQWRVKSLSEVEGRVTALELWAREIAESVASLRTDLSALAAAQRDAVRKDVFEQAIRDISGMRRALRVFEQDPRAYFYDPALTLDMWDTEHSLWLARVNEGIRFAFAHQRSDRLTLRNRADPAIMVQGDILLPAYDEVVRLSVSGGKSSKLISQLTHTEVTATKRTVSRTSIELGPTVTVCENQKDWATVGEAARTGSKLTVAGETFQVVGLSTNAKSANWNADPNSVGHKNYDVQKVSVNTYTSTYWSYKTTTVGLNGSVYGQTWLNSQTQILTGIRLRFTSVGNDGDVHLLTSECDDSGRPEIAATISNATVEHRLLKPGQVQFDLGPGLYEAGERYGWYAITVGKHSIRYVTGNKFAEGSMFQLSDGAWAVPSLTDDFEFELVGPKFRSTRTVVDFQPITLENGIDYLRILAAGWAPDGTLATWEFKPSDSNTWREFSPDGADALYGLPASLDLRLTMVGTTDLAPSIVLDEYARVEVGRHRGDLRAITKPLALGVTATSITVDLTIDQWVEGEHTASVKLMAGATTYTPTNTSIWQDPDKPKRRRLTCTFTALPNVTSVRVLIEGTKSGVDAWFGENLFLMVN